MTDPAALPLELWHRHRSLRVGDRWEVELPILGPGEVPSRAAPGPPVGDRWPPALAGLVLVGAGFAVTGHRDLGDRRRWVLRRERTLADTVDAGLRLLLVGLNPSPYAADAGVGFARPGNRAWPALLAAGVASVDRDPLHLLEHHRVGMTDLVKRATARADELAPEEFVAGLARLHTLCTWLRPDAVCVLGITGWRTATGDRRAAIGPQPVTVGGRPVYVAPNPSGLNAHTSVDDLAARLRAAMALGCGG